MTQKIQKTVGTPKNQPILDFFKRNKTLLTVNLACLAGAACFGPIGAISGGVLMFKSSFSFMSKSEEGKSHNLALATYFLGLLVLFQGVGGIIDVLVKRTPHFDIQTDVFKPISEGKENVSKVKTYHFCKPTPFSWREDCTEWVDRVKANALFRDEDYVFVKFEKNGDKAEYVAIKKAQKGTPSRPADKAPTEQVPHSKVD